MKTIKRMSKSLILEFKFILIISFFLFSVTNVFSQKKSSNKPPLYKDFKFEKQQKINYTKYPFEKRLEFFPFNEATLIKIVSYNINKNDTINSELIEIDETLEKNLKKEEVCKFKLYNEENDSINLIGVIQTKSLNYIEVKTLSDILLNTCYRWKVYDNKKLGCYFPKNAIIFFDKNEKPFYFIEICFECREIKFAENKINKITMCTQLYEELDSFFKNNGIATKYTQSR